MAITQGNIGALLDIQVDSKGVQENGKMTAADCYRRAMSPGMTATGRERWLAKWRRYYAAEQTEKRKKGKNERDN